MDGLTLILNAVRVVQIDSIRSPSSTRQQRLGRGEFLGHILYQLLLERTLNLHRSGPSLDGNPAPVCKMCSAGEASAGVSIIVASNSSAGVRYIVAIRVEPIRWWRSSFFDAGTGTGSPFRRSRRRAFEAAFIRNPPSSTTSTTSRREGHLRDIPFFVG